MKRKLCHFYIFFFLKKEMKERKKVKLLSLYAYLIDYIIKLHVKNDAHIK